MFSRLDPYFKTQMRQTENTDTRQAIRREEKQDSKKKDSHKSQNTDNSLWEDSSGVSVEALEAFLSQFLEESYTEESSGFLTEQKQKTRTEEDSRINMPSENSEEPAMPQNTHTARALQAYQTMSYRAHPEELLLNAEQNRASLTTPQNGLSTQEVRMIHALIDNLKTLAEHNIHSVTIEQADSFLQGIEKGIKIASKMHGVSL